MEINVRKWNGCAVIATNVCRPDTYMYIWYILKTKCHVIMPGAQVERAKCVLYTPVSNQNVNKVTTVQSF